MAVEEENKAVQPDEDVTAENVEQAEASAGEQQEADDTKSKKKVEDEWQKTPTPPPMR